MRTLLVILLLSLCYFETAQTDDLKTLTLESSIDFALEHNPEYRIAAKELKKAESDVRIAYSTILPKLNASANFQHAWEIQESTIPNFIKEMLGPQAPPDMPDFVKISFGLENTVNYGANFSQPLFLGGAGIAGIQAANAAKRVKLQNLESSRQQIIYETANAFYGCLLAEELVKVREEAMHQAEANLEVVSKRYDVGTASGFDKMRAEVDVANLQPELISAKNDLQSAITGLRTILGMQPDQNIEVSGTLYFVEDSLETLSLESLQDIAMKNRPEFHALQEQEYITRKGITIARSEFMPKIVFSTDYSFMGMRNDLKFVQDDFSKGFTSAVSLQIPLFQGFRNQQNYQKAKLDHKIILDTKRQALDGIAAEVEVAYNTFHEAMEKYLSAKETVKLAEEALRLANLMYEEGTNTQLDVLNSSLALNQARLNYASSLYEYQVARYRLRKVTGTLEGIIE